MTVDPLTSPADLIALRKRQLQEIREQARGLAVEGRPGREIAAFLSESTDAFLQTLFNEALAGLNEESRSVVTQHAAVVAVGGSGRGEVAPYSDVDLLFLYEGAAARVFPELAAILVRDCWDSGVKLGHTVQLVREALSMARREPQFATSLVTARWLAGSEKLVRSFRTSFQRNLARRRAQFIDECVDSRQEERENHGSAVKQLEPDIKRAPGGLRDIHLMQWVAFARYKLTDIAALRRSGLLPESDAERLENAYEFLTRIRTELHFHAAGPQDVLTREDQLRIAEQRGTAAEPGQRPVESFMQTYFRHSSAIAEISEQFIKRARPRDVRSRLLGPLTSHRFDDVCVLRSEGVDVRRRDRAAMVSDMTLIIRLFRAALLYGVEPVPELLEAIREAVPQLEATVTPECGRLLREVLRSPGDLAHVLRLMYSTGVLEFLIPEFRHARGLIQFNQYHSYTVDEHTFRAIDAVVAFARDDGPLGTAYRAVRHKASLHLALLLHDAGKGYPGDHSVVGAGIARDVGDRLAMTDHKQIMVETLVRKHLVMSHLAFRRDITDTRVVIEFARDIGSPEMLRMLYVLTAADIIAVGPDVWTDWKAELLGELYQRSMEVLSGRPYKHLEEERTAQTHAAVRRHLQSGLGDDFAGCQEWLDRQLPALPVFYLAGEEPVRIARDLLKIRALEEDGISVRGQYAADTDTVEYRIITRGAPTAGCFHRIAGALSSLRMDILTAGICTTEDDVVVDSFRVLDRDYSGEVPEERIERVCQTVEQVLRGEATVESLLEKGRAYVSANASAPLSDLQPRVVIDNDCSDNFTVIDVFSHDHPGLLHALARALFELDLSVQLARIATHLDQVVDVFYVTDLAGRKVEGHSATSRIRERLQHEVRPA